MVSFWLVAACTAIVWLSGKPLVSPLLLLGLLSREALMRWRDRLLSAGKTGKILLGSLLLIVGLMILSGLDKKLEALLVEASPAWLTELTTRF